MFRSCSMENKEIMALYGGGRDEDSISEEDSEGGEEGKGGRGVRSSLSLEIYGLQRERQVYFSNQEYYRRLEELKSAHLRNMAELEKMYISQDDRGQRGSNQEDRLSISGPTRRLQRINSQEELDFHESSSGSDQSEVSLEDGLGALHWTSQDRTFESNVLLSPEQTTTQKQFRFQLKASCPKPPGRPTRPSGGRIRPNAKVTVPKPFQMMLREEERKRHKVRTRSEIELENSLLRRELEELRECQKKFRASPAPAHIHLPLYEAISRRSNQSSNQDAKTNRASAAISSFNFLEREKRKREANIVAQLGPKVERQAFKARPVPTVPSLVSGGRNKTTGICPLEREATEGHSYSNSDLEADALQSDASSDSSRPQRSSSSKLVKKHIELSIEMVKEQEVLHQPADSQQLQHLLRGAAGRPQWSVGAPQKQQ
ncbi:protein FAM161A-like [Amphiprion ocellaris]|uniref:protein FAM161A-like n=1 Tax=Amphiprion ocellaris TaxID=80972 RepID=UPI0016497D72|nr:protein FAM161A-like [Amphiprion ocellaris]XP_054874311.1 protein FAM161A-like [Amphiprion ocellaris]